MTHRPTLRVVLMGGFEVSVGGRAVEPSAWRLGKAKDLIKVLALSPGRRLPRDQLLEILWPGRELVSALNNLHQVLHATRRAIGSAGGDGHACLTLRDETVRLCPDGGIEVDADAFESAAHDALASGRRADIEAALDLHHGDLLPDDRYADWAHARREGLQRLRATLMFELAARLAEAGDLAVAAEVLDRLVREDPTDERSQRALVRVHGLSGDRTAAIRRYEALEQVLRDELGVAPDPTTREVFEAVVSGEIGPAQDSASGPEPPTNLGPPLSSLVGRTQELAELAVLTRANRLVTLVGAAQVLAQRAHVELAGGDPGAAVAGLSDAVALWRTLGYGIAVACSLRDLGEAHAAAGMPDHARATLAEAAGIFDRNGYSDEAERCRRHAAG